MGRHDFSQQVLFHPANDKRTNKLTQCTPVYQLTVYKTSSATLCSFAFPDPTTHVSRRVGGHADGELLVRVDLLDEDVPVVAREEDLGGLVAQDARLLRHPHVAQDPADPTLQNEINRIEW